MSYELLRHTNNMQKEWDAVTLTFVCLWHPSGRRASIHFEWKRYKKIFPIFLFKLIKHSFKIIIKKLCQLHRKGWWVIWRKKERCLWDMGGSGWDVIFYECGWGELLLWRRWRAKKKSRCLHEHKVLPFGWKILNGHVQMSVYMISRSRSPNTQM